MNFMETKIMDIGYSFDKRLAYAETPPSWWYTDADFLEYEKKKIFSRTWQLVGRTDQVAEAGGYFTANICDESIIVARGADERLRSFSNVCRHRAGPVASGEGKRKLFQCGYHGWTYGLDGKLIATPEFDGVECFGKESNCLPQFKTDAWAGLLFVNLNGDSVSLEETLEDLPARLKNRDLADFKFVFRKDWHIDCN